MASRRAICSTRLSSIPLSPRADSNVSPSAVSAWREATWAVAVSMEAMTSISSPVSWDSSPTVASRPSCTRSRSRAA